MNAELLEILSDISIDELSKTDKESYNNLLKLVQTTIEEKKLKELLKTQIKNRWLDIKDSKLSYFRNPENQLNRLCIQMAFILEPSSPHLILMPDLIGKTDTFGNCFNTLKFYRFITTKEDNFFISLKEFFALAWQRVIQGEKNALQYLNENEEICNLNPEEQEAIVNIHAPAEIFFRIASKPTKHDQESLLDKLQSLRQGLLEGDVRHQGTEFDAAAAANIAIKNFHLFYESLSEERKTRLRSFKANPESTTNLGYYLDHLFKPLHEASSNATSYCIRIIGHEIESIINYNSLTLREESASAEYLALKKVYQMLTKSLKNPLYRALLCDDLDNFKRHFFKLNTINYPIDGEDTCLHISIRFNKETISRWLMQQPGIDINAQASGKTPLYIAAQEGHVNLVKALLTKGADVNHALATGNTPLYIAAKNGHMDVVKTLLTFGAHVDKAANNITPLYIASQNGYVMVVDCLVNHGAHINNAINNEFTALFIAAQNGHNEVVACLLAHGAEVDKATSKAVTPLFMAAQNGHTESVKCLLSYGANSNKTMNTGATPLFIAAQNGHTEVVNHLLAHGAEINKTTSTGATPLYIATKNGRTEVVKSLLAQGADFNKSTSRWPSPLYTASKEGHVEIVKCLLSHGADPIKSCDGKLTSLHIAAQQDNSSVFKALLNAIYFTQNPEQLFNYLPCIKLFNAGLQSLVKQSFWQQALTHFVNYYNKGQNFSSNLEKYIHCFNNVLQKNCFKRYSSNYQTLLRTLKEAILHEIEHTDMDISQYYNDLKKIMDYQRRVIGLFNSNSSKKFNRLYQDKINNPENNHPIELFNQGRISNGNLN